MNKPLLLIATFFNVGRFPIAPGTLASFVTTVVFYLVNVNFSITPTGTLGAAILVFLVGIPAASAAEKDFAQKDPRPVVIDEVAGQLIALAFIPDQLLYYAAAFFLFRFFDIVKPFPVNWADKHLPGGFGIMFDDVLAGLYTMGVIHVLNDYLINV